MDAAALRREFGPAGRALAARFFSRVRFSPEDEAEWRRLNEQGFVVHVMRTTAWVNYLYLAWALVTRGLPPVRAVVNLRRWFTRPFTHTVQRGDFDVRFTYARRQQGSGLIFLRQSAFGSTKGRGISEDPFPALVAMARKSERPLYLVPELFVWEKVPQPLQPTWVDYVFGSPEAPGFLHTLVAFFRNYHRAQFRVGRAVDLQAFIRENPEDSDAVLGRKVRSVLYNHLARETRAVFGPPVKTPERLMEETLRDPELLDTLAEEAQAQGRKQASLLREAARNLRQIAARLSPSLVGLVSVVLDRVFNRIYDGIEVDEAGLDRTMKAAADAPLILCPSHKSHIDYLVLSYALFKRGYTVPHVAAGANLSFFPAGWILRRAGAFFLRRSFKGDKVYGATFRAYVKKLIHDGIHQEFFPEGGRSRTGKLLQPRLGMFTWQVDAVLGGARDDVNFVPVAIDYEKVVESRSYSKELAGGEKKAEDLKALLSAPKVLAYNYGRIHVSFDAPISLAAFMKARGLDPSVPPTEEQRKGLVRAVANRVMYGISRVSTVTPHALAAAALLGHRRRGVTVREFTDRVVLLRRVAEFEGVPLSRSLDGSPADPTVIGPMQDALRSFGKDGLVTIRPVKDEVIYQAADERRAELSFYKNTLMNLVAGRSLVATAVLCGKSTDTLEEIRGRALVLSRLFKLEFTYRVGATFEAIFAGTVDTFVQVGVLRTDGDRILPAPEPHAARELEFFSDLLTDLLESYLLTALTLDDVARGSVTDRKGFVKAALETGKVEFLAGRLVCAESLSRTTLENALGWLLEQGFLREEGRVLKLGERAAAPEARAQFVAQLRGFLRSTVG